MKPIDLLTATEESKKNSLSMKPKKRLKKIRNNHPYTSN